MVRPGLPFIRTGQNLPVGNNTGIKVKRQANKEMGKHRRVDRFDSE